jgi:hypothetical protein
MGTLINSRYVLTALSCLKDKSLSDIVLDKGQIEQVIKGPEPRDELNLALLRLAKPVEFDNHTLPACLQESKLTANFMNYVGWSLDKMSSFYVRDLSDEDRLCKVFPEQMICTKTVRFMYTFCTMDVGGPLHVEGDLSEGLVGVTLLTAAKSSGVMHDKRDISYVSYQYNARLTHFFPWIRSVVQGDYCPF